MKLALKLVPIAPVGVFVLTTSAANLPARCSYPEQMDAPVKGLPRRVALTREHACS